MVDCSDRSMDTMSNCLGLLREGDLEMGEPMLVAPADGVPRDRDRLALERDGLGDDVDACDDRDDARSEELHSLSGTKEPTPGAIESHVAHEGALSGLAVLVGDVHAVFMSVPSS